MQVFLFVAQIIVGVLLSGAILLQVTGSGFGRVWGGLSQASSRRGIEGLVFNATFVLSFLFILISAIQLVV